MDAATVHVPTSPGVLRPGWNCWRIEQAERVAFLIDGADYFAAFRSAVLRAQRSIIILSWDIDSRVLLVRDDAKDDGWPRTLADLLQAVVRRRRGLHVYVLNWDFATLLEPDREWPPIKVPAWKSHRRLHFYLDDQHPAGASQHQKIVVIDDTVAFVGGFDLARGRWDSPAHVPHDPRRIETDGPPFRPHHDVQMAVSGRLAAALGRLARRRWKGATGTSMRPPEPGDGDPWPPELPVDIRDVAVAIARTSPKFKNRCEIREVETLYLDTIAAARRLIFIENQYFTASRIVDALARRLETEQGPEIVVILPSETTGWLAQLTMDVLRDRSIRRLQQADRYGRLGVYYPDNGAVDQPINVHSKVMAIDDELVRVGSSNLNNRSMGLDTECDLAIAAAGDQRVSAAIAQFRHRLLAEHLGTTSETVAAAVSRDGSTLRGIESLRGGNRTLSPLQCGPASDLEVLVPPEALLDPERPIAGDGFVTQFLHPDERTPTRRRVAGAAVFLLALMALSAAWRWTPLHDWLNVHDLVQSLDRLRGEPLVPVIVLAAYVLGGLVSVPILLLIVVTVLAFGPWLGLAYAFTGSMLNAMVTYGAGHLLGQHTLRRIAGSRLNRLSRRLARRGVLAVMAVRVLPVAPFTVVNVVAGASHIRFRDFMLGTSIGMAPGMISIALFAEAVTSSIRDPGVGTFLSLLAVAVVIAAAAWGLRRGLADPNRPAGDS